MPDLLTLISVLVDDWYQTHTLAPERVRSGRKHALSVSETVTILLAMDVVPVVYDLVPAHTDERDAAMRVLSRVQHCDIWADKGFLGEEWQPASRRT